MLDEFEGWVLRAPRVAQANAAFTGEARALVREVDKPTYRAAYLDNPNAGNVEYLVRAQETNDIVVPDEITETATVVSGLLQDATVFQFNPQGRAIETVLPVDVTPTPDAVDSVAGLITYNVPPGVLPVVVYTPRPLALEYTRNEAGRTRFGYDDRTGRWEPLPGSAPESLGDVPEDGLLSVPVVEYDALGDVVAPRVLIGSPDSTTALVVPVNLFFFESTFADYRDGILTPPVGEGVLNIDTGELLLASDIVVSTESQPVFFTRVSFFDYSESTGAVGVVGDTLYLNPLPLSGEIPLLRLGYRQYLTASVAAGAPVGVEDARIDPTTGRVTFSNAILTSELGETLYYDGVLTGQNVTPITPDNLGTITADQSGIGAVNLSTHEPESLILYLGSSGVAVRRVDLIESSADFEEARNLAPDRAQVALDTGEVRLSQRLAASAVGDTLYVGSRDFVIEDGITFRLDQSPVDPTNERGVPDGQGTLRLSETLLQGAINPGPSVALTQVPLTDVAGFGENVFYRVDSGASKRTLTPDEDVIYDFDNRQLFWAQRKSTSQTLATRSYDVRLPDQVVLNRNYQFELNRGDGFVTLEDGVNATVEFDTGIVRFTEAVGGATVEGVARVAGNVFTFLEADLTGVTTGLDPLLAPILRTGDSAYIVTDVTGQDVTVLGDVLETGSVSAQIIENPEPIYVYALAQESLTPQLVYPFLVQEIDTADSQFAPGTPDGDADEVFIELADGTRRQTVLLVETTLGRSDATLTLPAFAQNVYANYSVFLDEQELTYSGAAPNPGEYTLTGAFPNAVVTLHPDDVATLGSVTITPTLSDPYPTGEIELLASDRSLGFPDDVLAEGIVSLYSELDVRLQDNLLYFERPFQQGERLVVRYVPQGETTPIEEPVGFRTVETVSATGGLTPFAATRDLDTTRDIITLVNGSPKTLAINAGSKLVNTAGLRAGRVVGVNYAAYDALGGEQNASLLSTPVSPDVVLNAGTAQRLLGDLTNVLTSGAFVQADSASFFIDGAPVFDGEYTSFTVGPALVETLINPTTLVSQTPINYQIFPSLTFEPASRGMNTLTVFGDAREALFANRILVLDSDPYYVEDVAFNEQVGATTLTVASKLARDYVSPLVAQSRYKVYAPGALTLEAERVGLEGPLVEVIRRTEDTLEVVDPDYYLYEAAGRVTLDPTLNDPLQQGEVVYLRYTALDPVDPREIGGQLYLPRFRATYTYRVNATTQNGYLGARLVTTQTLRAPDTFYFRVVSLNDYVAEVADDLAEQAAQSAPAGGPVITFAGSNALNDKGQLTLVGEGEDLYDQDRAARQYLAYYNALVTAFENIQEVVDGRVIGDRDGKFRFVLRDEETPGGVDPFTGRLLPYYVNAANPGVRLTSNEIRDLEDLTIQAGLIENNIDDIVLTSKRPFALDVGLPPELVFTGTFKRAWEPSKFSRLYPEEVIVRTVTLAPLGGGADYTFEDDFNQVLADAGVDGVLALRDVKPRAAAATIQEVEPGDPIVLTCAQTYNPVTGELSNAPYDLTTGDPSRTLPPFTVGDHVDIGRVTYARSGEEVTRTEVVVARDLIVDAVTASTLTLSEGNGTAIGAVDAQSGDTVFVNRPIDLATVATLDDLDPEDMPFYRPPLDVILNEADGEILNPTLPPFFADLLGQKVPPPGTYLQAVVSFKNARTEPFEVPALFGEGVSDDGDTIPPFVSPLPDSELQRLPAEGDRITDIFTRTTQGQYAGVSTKVAPSNLMTTEDLSSDPVAPFDVVVLEGLPDFYSAYEAGVNTLTLAAFEYRNAAAVYEVPDLYQGGGNVVGDTLTDLGTDFTAFSGATITLNIDGGNSYSVAALNNGSIVATIPIVETGAQTYTLSAQGVGQISADLTSLLAVGVDFSNAQGSFTVTRPATPASIVETYTVDTGAPGVLTAVTVPDGFSAPVAVSAAVTITSGAGAIDQAAGELTTAASLVNVAPGDTLMVDPDSANAARYRIASAAGGVITIDAGANPAIYTTGFYLDEGAADFRVVRPRRFSVEVDAWQTQLIQERVLYEDNANADADIAPLLTGVSANPSTPLQERLDTLVDLLLPDPFLTQTGTATNATQVLTGSVDFLVEGVEVGDLVRVDTGINRGFYFVTGVTSTTLTLDGNQEFVVYTLSDDPATTYTVTKATTFDTRTYQLALSEQYGIQDLVARIDDGIRATVTDTEDILGTPPFNTLTGDPTDAALTAHTASLTARLDRIRDVAPTLTQDIEGVLKGSEALYDVRFSWVDYRVNLETGTLSRIRQYNARVEKRRAKALRDLLRLFSTQ